MSSQPILPTMDAEDYARQVVFNNSDDLWVSIKNQNTYSYEWVLVPENALKMYELFHKVKINFDFETFEKQIRIAQQKLKEKQIALLYSSTGYAHLQYLVDNYDTQINEIYYVDDDTWLYKDGDDLEYMAKAEFKTMFGADKKFSNTPVIPTTDIEIVRDFISNNEPIVLYGRRMDNDSIKTTKKILDATLKGFKTGVNKTKCYTEFVIYKLPDVE